MKGCHLLKELRDALAGTTSSLVASSPNKNSSQPTPQPTPHWKTAWKKQKSKPNFLRRDRQHWRRSWSGCSSCKTKLFTLGETWQKRGSCSRSRLSQLAAELKSTCHKGRCTKCLVLPTAPSSKTKPTQEKKQETYSKATANPHKTQAKHQQTRGNR